MTSGSGEVWRKGYTRPDLEPAVLLSATNTEGRRDIVGPVWVDVAGRERTHQQRHFP
jgi:hypothetical protein